MDSETAVIRESQPGRPKNQKISMVVFSCLVLIGIIGAFIWWNQLRTSISTENAKVSGDIVDISFRASGQVKAIHVGEGDYVTKDQLLAELSNRSAQIALDQAGAGVKLAAANYSRLPYDIKSLQVAVSKSQAGVEAAAAGGRTAELALQDAEQNLKRQEQLLASGAISQSQLDAARLNYDKSLAAADQARANYKSALTGVDDSKQKLQASLDTSTEILKAQLDSARAAAANAQLNLDNTIIKSPVNGTVLRISTVPGENINSGQQVLTIADLSSAWITANIEEKKVARVKIGQRADVKIDAYPGKVFKGKVVAISDASQSTFAMIPGENSAGNFTKVAQRLTVKIKLDNPGVKLKPGMSSVVKIITGR